MRNSLFTLLVVCLFGTFAVMAQDSTSTTTTQSTTTTATPSSSGQSSMPSSQSGTTGAMGQSGTSTVPSDQSAMSNGATQTSSGSDQSADGCLMKDSTGYYIQPTSGGARTQLSPSRSLDAFVGQHIRVSGGNNVSSPAAAGTEGMAVTRIQTISETCAPSGATTPGAAPSSQPPQQ